MLADLGASLGGFRVEQQIAFDETMVEGEVAFDRATISTTVSPRAGGEARRIRSRTFTLLKRAANGGWVVRRTTGVVVTAE